MRAVVYARVSSQAQRDRHTIASQLSTLPVFIEARGWKLVRPADHYVDDGRTAKAGHLAERGSFVRLLRDAERGEFDVVAVVDLDRLTRSEDLRERGEVLGAFQSAGVQIAVASTGQVLDLRSSVGDLMSTLGAFFAAEENRKRRDRSVRGKHDAIRKGKKPAGPTPFGYLYDRGTGTWSIDPDLGPVVVEIFNRIAAGESCYAVAVDLQARGVPRARPSKTKIRRAGWWSRERVHQIVRARTYLGEWTADKRKKMTITIPPIVDDQLYDRADQALIRSGKRGLMKVRHHYLAQGIAKCALCGAPVGCASTRGAHGKRHFYYVCSHRVRPRGERCMLPMRRVDELDEQLWKSLSDLLMRPDLVERALAARADDSSTVVRDWGKDFKEFERKLARLNDADATILDRFSHGHISTEVMDRHLARSRREREMLEKQLAVAREQVKTATTEREHVEALKATAETLRSRLATASADERREIVRTLVPGRGENWIVIGPKHVEAKLLLAAQGEPAPAFAKVDRAG